MAKESPILLLITTQDWGGAQAFLFELAKDMRTRNLPVKVCAGGHGELGGKCREEGIPFIDLRHMARGINPLANLISLIELIGLFRREKPQAVHLNSTMMGVVGSLASKLTSVPWTVYCIGGWVFNEQLPSWKKKLYIGIERLTAHWKDIIVCVHPGDTELARHLRIAPRERLMTIPNGIDADLFEQGLLDRASALTMLDVRPGICDLKRGIVIGTIANAYPPKNLIKYLDVCKQVHEINPDYRFVIIGDGPLMPELRQRHAELELESVVLLTGRRMDARMLYRAFDAFVLPSTKEGMSITLLEAMAAHVPIIATDVGANKWMLDGAGFIVPPNDRHALAQAILDLKQDERQVQDMTERAYRAVKERFSWNSTSEQTIDIVIHH